MNIVCLIIAMAILFIFGLVMNIFAGIEIWNTSYFERFTKSLLLIPGTAIMIIAILIIGGCI